MGNCGRGTSFVDMRWTLAVDELNGGKFILGILTSTIMHIARMNFTLTVLHAIRGLAKKYKFEIQTIPV